jgi:hypothetical protein
MVMACALLCLRAHGNALSITRAQFDKLNVLLGSGDALLRLLLESVQHIHHSGKTHGINGPVGVAVEIIDQLQDSTVGRIGARRVRAMRGPMGVIRRFCLPSSKMNVLLSGTAICFAL